ncbi:MAG: hypothetical protein MPF33_00895 [Candidatus Aramenus sp.]|jgi:hypothetical protein|nr:hypothetical protein [Candidatus Aramenus sp.]
MKIKVTTEKFNDYVERGALAILNSFLAIELVKDFGFPQLYEYALVPFAVIITVFIPFFMTSFISVLYVSTMIYNMTAHYTLALYQGYLDVFLLAVLGILLPVTVELKFKSLQAFIGINSVVAYTAFPASALFLFAGISEKRSVVINSISSLPLVIWMIYPNFVDPPIYRLSLAIALVIVGAAMMGVKKAFSPIGAVLPAVALYYAVHSLPLSQVIEAALLAVAINVVPVALQFLENKSIERSEFEQLRNSLNGSMEEAIISLQRLNKVDDERLSSLCTKNLEFLASVYNDLAKCNDRKCTEELSLKFSRAKEEIERQIDEELFKIIVEFNEKARKLRKLNLPVGEIPPGERKFTLNSSGVDYAYSVISSINSSLDATVKSLNETAKNLNQIFGTNFNLLLSKNVDKIVEASEALLNKELIERMKSLIEMEKDILAKLNDSSITQLKLKLTRDLNLIDLDNVTFYEVNQLVAATREINKIIDSEVQKISNTRTNGKLPPFLVERILNAGNKLQKSIKDAKSLYDKFSEFLASIDEVNEVLDILSKEEVLEDLFSLMESNSSQIISTLSEGSCINISDIGIDESFSPYVIYWLENKELKVKKVKNSICLS